jgi:pilus assembly protein Flp/PilA
LCARPLTRVMLSCAGGAGREISSPRAAGEGRGFEFLTICLNFSCRRNPTFGMRIYVFASSAVHNPPRTVVFQELRELSMSQLLARFWKDQSGATAIEYGLIAAGISVVIIAVVNGIGTKLNTSFGSISTQLK